MSCQKRRRTTLALLLATLLAAAALAEEGPARRLVVSAMARVRETPSTAARVVATLAMGEVVPELLRGGVAETIDGKEGLWYRVRAATGEEGWVHGSLTRPVPEGGEAAAQLELAREVLAREQAPFPELVALASFARREAPRAGSRTARAELELAHLLALRAAAATIPMGEAGTGFRPWLDSHRAELVYSEPAGTWLLSSGLLWQHHDRYRDLPQAEAWAAVAAGNMLPGECEGWVPCYLAIFSQTWGRYLEAYPAGPHADEGLDRLAGILREVVQGFQEGERSPFTLFSGPEDRAELLAAATKARATVAAARGQRRDELLGLLDAVLAKAR